MHLSIALKFAVLFNVTLKVRSPFFSLAYSHVHILNSCKCGLNPLTHSEDYVHLSIFGLNFAISIFNVTLKTRSMSPKLYQLFCHVIVLDSCKIGQNQLTTSEDNVHLSMFCPKFSSFYSNVTLEIR